MNDISSVLNTLNAEVMIFRSAHNFVDDALRWGCTIHLERDGTSIKVKGTGPHADVALAAAYANLQPLISTHSVASALRLPALSAPEIDLEALHPGAAE